MAQSTFMRFAPVFLGVAAASTLLAPLSAQAASASYGTGFVRFTNIKLTLDNADLFNVEDFPASKRSATSGSLVPGGFTLPGIGNPDSGGPDLTPPTTGPTTSEVNLITAPLGGQVSFSNAKASILIPPPVAGMTFASSNAETDFSLVRPIAESTSNSVSNQTSLIFNAIAGQTVALTGILDAFLRAEVVGFGVSKVQYNASFTITGPGGFFFSAPPIIDAIAVIGGPDSLERATPVTAIALVTPTLTTAGTYQVVFNSNIASQGYHAATVPEPSAVLGLAGVALVGVLTRKRRLG